MDFNFLKMNTRVNKYHILKTFIDYALALLLILPAFILIIIFAIIAFIELKEFPFYWQERGLTLEKYRFKILKIKTIKTGMVKIQSMSNNEGIILQPNIRIELTPFSSWLRNTGFDELPQLLNILFGQMSFIGPRPLMLSDLTDMKIKYPVEYELRCNINSKPGISGLWQIFGDRNSGPANLLFFDKLYDENYSPALDFALFLFTAHVVLFAINTDKLNKRNNLVEKIFLLPGASVLFKKLISLFQSIADGNNKYYTLSLPCDWWTQSNTIENQKSGGELSLLEFDNKSRKGKSAS